MRTWKNTGGRSQACGSVLIFFNFLQKTHKSIIRDFKFFASFVIFSKRFNFVNKRLGASLVSCRLNKRKSIYVIFCLFKI